MSSRLTIECIDQIEGFAELKGEWSQLASARASPLMSHAWFYCAAKTLHTRDRLWIVVARRGGRISGVAPLVQVRRGANVWLELIGARHLCEPSGLPAEDPDSLMELCSAIASKRLPVALQRVDPSSNVLSAFRKAGRWRGITVRVRSASTLWVATDKEWPGIQSKISARRRADLRRARRALETIGPVRIECLRPGPEAVTAALDSAFEIEAASWKSRAGTAVVCREPMRRFFEEMSRSFATSGNLEVRFLHAGDECVAMQLGLEYGNRWWDLKIGYDEAYAKASPGMQLTAGGLMLASERRLASHEFLGSPADWERRWASGERSLESVIFYPFSAHGACAIAIDLYEYCMRAFKKIQRE